MSNEDAPPDELVTAYEQRTEQLYDARGALTEAVAALTAELARVRDEHDHVLIENQALRAGARTLTDAIEQAREYRVALEAELGRTRELAMAMKNMKVVRWTAPMREAVYKLRNRLG